MDKSENVSATQNFVGRKQSILSLNSGVDVGGFLSILLMWWNLILPLLCCEVWCGALLLVTFCSFPGLADVDHCWIPSHFSFPLFGIPASSLTFSRFAFLGGVDLSPGGSCWHGMKAWSSSDLLHGGVHALCWIAL
ncbi:hypothetical protein Nepgr_016479 [Nepenthes gracilis]|uniref:Uncharacterized protein n=1 Tax=Nepenthes gracilis TaxID=150966 RepID=A0AAD3XRN5_NEPGR|nr:hypothetical protein Nepgr_016479 [Nepenthes gracilis]